LTGLPTEAPALLRESLLRETVAWCATRSPYYRDRFGAAAQDFAGLADLPKLPVLFREEVVRHQAEILCDPSLPAAVQHTTGTTGASLHVYRGPAEQSFVWEFFSAQLTANPRPGPRPLYMNLVNAYHGSLTGMPSHAYVLSAGVYDRAQASQARGILERTFDLPGVEPRVSMVMGTERMVKALTAYLLADGFDLAGSAVKTITLFGGHVTPARKRLLGQLWGAAVRDRYSLTEMFGGAVECGVGGPWVFDPLVVPEVVHPRTLEPLTEGVGVLLLTALYPFTQQMPLVRYFTGDLVEVAGDPQAPAGLQVRYLGRLKRSILDVSGPRVRPLLLSGPLYEILEANPDIAISPRFPDLSSGRGLELSGDLRYAVEHHPADPDGRAPERITLKLGLRYAPFMFQDRVRELVHHLAEQILAAHPELSARCSDGRMELHIVPCDGDTVAPYDSK
jgi:phenylacetate-coenzyme A ligase PaaK-like adenylate-forming protein